MYDMYIINDGTPIIRDGDAWKLRGVEVNPDDLIHTLVALVSVVEVQAFRANGTVDVIEYVDGKHYHTTRNINKEM